MTLVTAALMVGKLFLVALLAIGAIFGCAVGGTRADNGDNPLPAFGVAIVLAFLAITLGVWFYNSSGPLWSVPS